MENISILVSSCDKFNDTWIPFFKLYEKYWHDKNIPIYLSTDKDIFHYPGFNITSTQININNKKISWAKSIRMSLLKIPTEFVLLIFDDFFINENVNINILEKSFALIQSDQKIGAINLSATGPVDCKKEIINEFFFQVKQTSKYKISCHPSIWRKDYLLKMLNDNENAWQFEIFGTIRAHNSKKLIYRIASEKAQPIKFIKDTGIIKGKWNIQVEKLFIDNDIVIDYNKRGFFEISHYWYRKWSTIKKLILNPFKLIYYLLVLRSIYYLINILRQLSKYMTKNRSSF